MTAERKLELISMYLESLKYDYKNLSEWDYLMSQLKDEYKAKYDLVVKLLYLFENEESFKELLDIQLGEGSY